MVVLGRATSSQKKDSDKVDVPSSSFFPLSFRRPKVFPSFSTGKTNEKGRPGYTDPFDQSFGKRFRVSLLS